MKESQIAFDIRMAREADDRRTRMNLAYMKEEMDMGADEIDESKDIREMTPEERLVFCLDKGLILNLPIPLHAAAEGQVIGDNVVHTNGEVLLKRGSYLTRELISRLARFNIQNVSVMFHPDNPYAKKAMSGNL